jgi:hypothetical protein
MAPALTVLLRIVRILGMSLALGLTAPLSLGCAQVSQLLATFETAAPHLEARGPGTVFGSIECAAVDALIYAYLQTQTARDARVRAGTIYATGEGYSYDEPVVAAPLLPAKASYALKGRDVARFHIYPRVKNRDVNRRSEAPSKTDHRSVRFGDPLHRSLFILHPSLVIREYRGQDAEPVVVANLRRPARSQTVASARPTRVPGTCNQAKLSGGGLPAIPAERAGPRRDAV